MYIREKCVIKFIKGNNIFLFIIQGKNKFQVIPYDYADEI